MILYGMIVLAVLGQTDYSTLVRQGRAEYRSGHLSEAERLFNSALGLLQQDDEGRRAVALADLGDVYASKEEFSKAERDYSESLSLYKRLSDQIDTGLVMQRLGLLCSRQGRDDEALRYLTEALRLAQSNPKPDSGRTAEALNGLGIVYYRKGNNKRAETLFNQALEMATASGIRYDVSGVLNNLGTAYVAERKFARAEGVLKRALEMREAEDGPSHPEVAMTLSALGVVYAETKRFAEAEAQYRRALEILAAHRSDFEPMMARMQYGLSITYRRAGRKSDADTALAEAAAVARRNLTKQPEMASIVEEYSALLKQQGKANEAEELRAQAQRARTAAGLVIAAHSLF